MKKILPIFAAMFIFACSSYPSTSTIKRLGGAEEIIQELSDPELRKGKVFVLANIEDFMTLNLRVNGEVLQISDSEVLSFDLIDGENTILSFGEIFGDEVLSCNQEEYIFNTNDYQEEATHYFVVQTRGSCYSDLHIEREGFFFIKSNPDSDWRNNPWILNFEWIFKKVKGDLKKQ